MDAVLESSAVTCGQAALFVMNSTNIDYSGSAFDFAAEKGWLKNASPDDRITLGQLSYLIMAAFKIKGVFMYSLFPGPRYAYRSMLNLSYIQGVSDPDMKVSGERFLLILGNVLAALADNAQGKEQ